MYAAVDFVKLSTCDQNKLKVLELRVLSLLCVPKQILRPDCRGLVGERVKFEKEEKEDSARQDCMLL